MFLLDAIERGTSLSSHHWRSDDGTILSEVRPGQSHAQSWGTACRSGAGVAEEAAHAGSQRGSARGRSCQARHHRHQAAAAASARGERNHRFRGTESRALHAAGTQPGIPEELVLVLLNLVPTVELP